MPDTSAADDQPATRQYVGLAQRLILRWGVWLLSIAFFAVMAVVFLRDEDSLWLLTFRKAALRMQAGEPINIVERDAYAYPPAMALLAVPLADLTPRTSHAAWYLVNVAATCALLVASWRLAGGPPLSAIHGRWHAVFWLTLLLSLRHLTKPLETRQFDMLIAALLVGGIHSLARGHSVRSGLLLGCGAAMKLTPLLFVPYLLWRGRWTATICLVAVVVAMNLLPDLLWPQTNGRRYVDDFRSMLAARVSETNPGSWYNDQLHFNQSLSGLVTRGAVIGFPLHFDQSLVTAPPPSPVAVGTLHAVVYGASAALLLVSAWCLRPPGHRYPIRRPGTSDGWGWAIEGSIVMCLMLLVSPMTSREHFAVLVLPITLLATQLFVLDNTPRQRTRLAVLAALLLATGPLSAKGIIGSDLGNLAMIWSVPTCFVVTLLGAMWSLRRIDARPLD